MWAPSYGKAERLKGGPRDPGRDRAEHELGRVRKPGTGDPEGRGRSMRGGIYGRRESSEDSCARASPDRAPAKPRGVNRSAEIINQVEFINLSKDITTNINSSIEIRDVKISYVS
jgi:hypothetical protein